MTQDELTLINMVRDVRLRAAKLISPDIGELSVKQGTDVLRALRALSQAERLLKRAFGEDV